jgi:hypothetical protein
MGLEDNSPHRHGRARRVEDARKNALLPGHPRLYCRSAAEDVDARHKAGHDALLG